MFRAARPDLLSGARFALYAERLMPLYERMQEIQNQPLPKGDPSAYVEAARAKMAAGEAIPLFRSVLFPEDDDGLA
jgi:hypothetical protein